MSVDGKVIEPYLTGSNAEDFVEFFSKKTFLAGYLEALRLLKIIKN